MPKRGRPELPAQSTKAAPATTVVGRSALQVAALPLRRAEDGGIEVLLITSRETRRWIVPKGCLMKSRKPHHVAEIEAREEAGVVGRIGKMPAGHYAYDKRLPGGDIIHCRVAVYALIVTGHLQNWREQGQRDVQWVSSEAAAELVQEPDLAALIRDLARLADVVPNGQSVADVPEPADALPAAIGSASSLKNEHLNQNGVARGGRQPGRW